MNVRIYDSFEALPERVRAAVSYPAQPDFFNSLDWFACLYRNAVDPGTRLRIYVAEDGDTPCGWLPCLVEQGDRLRSLTTYYSWAYSPLLSQARPVAVVDALIEAMAKDRPAWKIVRLDYLRSDQSETEQMLPALRSNGFIVEAQTRYDNWRLKVQGRSFEQYFAARSSQLRNTIKRKGKKLQQQHRARIDVHTSTGGALEQALQDYVAIYNKSWKQPEPHTAFTPELVRLCARLGILRLGVLYVDDRPAAAQLWIVTRTAYIYKLAYDDAFADLSVGSLLSEELFRRAIDQDRVDEIDYGVGSEGYKRDWMETNQSVLCAEGVNGRTLAGRAYLGGRSLYRVAKRLSARLRSSAPAGTEKAQ